MTLKNYSAQSRIALHLFSAFFFLCYFVKALYFLFTSNPLFSLEIQYPPEGNLIQFTLYAVLFAALSYFFIIFSYSLFNKPVKNALSSIRSPHKYTMRMAWVISIVWMVYFVYDHRVEVIERISTLSILKRQNQLRFEAFKSGDLGVEAAVLQFFNGIFSLSLVFAVKSRNIKMIFVGLIYLFCQIVLSDGSRFTLLSSIILAPMICLLVYFPNFRKSTFLRNLIYLSVFCLPVIVGLLLVARKSGSIFSAFADFKYFIESILVSFDPLDHLINYLYKFPIDWSGGRSLEEFWQLVPRKLVPEKPFLYGMLSLQESMYPNTIGAGTGTYMYGHYPMSFVVMSLDFFFIVGIFFHSLIAGLFLNFLDNCLDSSSGLMNAFFFLNILMMYHLIRVGIVNFIVGGLATATIPWLLFILFNWIAHKIKPQYS